MNHTSVPNNKLMNMEFPELGANCTLNTCKQLGEFYLKSLRDIFFVDYCGI